MDLSALPIIIHVGPPKTGSTTLQHHCFPHLVDLHFVGKPWFDAELPYDACVGLHKAVDAISLCDGGDYDADLTQKQVEHYFSVLSAYLERREGAGAFEGRIFLLSEERLVQEAIVSVHEIARRLAQLFPSGRICFVRRDPVAALRSAYVWYYARAWFDEDIGTWLRRGLDDCPGSNAAIVLKYYDYARLRQAFSANFASVREAALVDLRSNPEGFFSDLFGVLPVFSGDFRANAGTESNVSRNRIMCELHRTIKKSARIWNSLPLGKLPERREYIGEGGLWAVAERLLGRSQWGEAKFTFSPGDKAAIAAYYAQDGRHEDAPTAAPRPGATLPGVAGERNRC